jgi:hypothetical protein
VPILENAERQKLLAFFNSLKEDDKDIVLAMAESLVEKCKRYGISAYTASIDSNVESIKI